MSRPAHPRWSFDPPCQAGYWFHREDEDCDFTIVRVYRDSAGEWSLVYGDLGVDEEDMDDPAARCDYVQNYLNGGKAQWCRVLEPRDP